MPENPAGTWLVPQALVLLDFAVNTPYLPEMFPLKAYLHLVFAFLAAACLILCVFRTVLKLYQRDPREYRPSLWGLGIIVAVYAFLFILAGIVSSALEIIFTVSMTWMVYGLYKNMTAGDWGLGIIVAVYAFLFILAGIVSSALEIIFTVSMTWMVYGLYKNMTAGDGVS